MKFAFSEAVMGHGMSDETMHEMDRVYDGMDDAGRRNAQCGDVSPDGAAGCGV